MLTGIAILPSAELQARLVEFRRDHLVEISGPMLGLSENCPHISVLQCPFVEDVDHQVIVDELAGWYSQHGGSLVFDRLIYQPVAWVFALLARQQWQNSLQTRALELTEYLIDTARIAGRVDDKLTMAERESYLRYGYRYVGPSFLPHVTLGRTAGGAAELAAGLGEAFANEFMGTVDQPSEMVFYRAGESGVLAEAIARSVL